MTAPLKALGELLERASLATPRRFTQAEVFAMRDGDYQRMSAADKREYNATLIRIWQGNYLEQSAADNSRDAQEAFDAHDEDSLQSYLRKEAST